jgi:hypothetical protein
VGGWVKKEKRKRLLRRYVHIHRCAVAAVDIFQTMLIPDSRHQKREKGSLLEGH